MRILVILPLALALGGCATGRPTNPGLPADARTPAASVSAEEQPRSQTLEGPIGLHEAIEIALANNPEVAAMTWDASAAQARQEQADGERLPKLSLVGSYAHHLDEQRLLPVGQPGDPTLLSRDILSGDIVLSLPLFTGGRIINQIKAAELLQQAAMHRLSRSREELAFNVSSLFFSILAQRRVIESLEFSRRTLEEHASRIDALIAAQKAARVDRMRTEVRLADVQQQWVREKNLLAIQRRALANLLGLEDSIEPLSLQGELESREEAPPQDLEAALAQAWESRGDYLAARRALEAQARSVEVARAGYWPTVSLQASYGGRWAVGPTSGSGDTFGDIGRIGPVMEFPLFEGGRTEARIREQRAQLAAARERLRKLELQIRLEIEIALFNVRSSEERVEAIRKAIAQARESLRIEQEKYDLGMGAIVDVLDAQAALLESETTYYRVLAEHHTALAQLKLAMGEE